jgi:hypothetical protein
MESEPRWTAGEKGARGRFGRYSDADDRCLALFNPYGLADLIKSFEFCLMTQAATLLHSVTPVRPGQSFFN